MPRLSIIIVTHNSELFISDCLKSIFDQETSFPVNVIVVDNASTDGTVQAIRSTFPTVEVIDNNRNAGFAAANNLGIRQSQGDVLLLLNPDTKLLRGSIEAMMNELKIRTDVAVLGPKILNTDGSLQRTGVTFPSVINVVFEACFLDSLFPRSRIFGRHRRLYDDPDLPHEVDYLQGSCLLIRRTALDEVGLLDEDFFMYFEETDLCYRFKQKGWKVVYSPCCSVIHHGGGGKSYYDAIRLVYFHESFLRFLRKHVSPFRRFGFRVILFVRALLRSLVLTISGLIVRRAMFIDRARGYAKVMMLMIKGTP